MKKIEVINGPNINMLEYREDCYPPISYDELTRQLTQTITNMGFAPQLFQSNVEGQIINEIHSIARNKEEYERLVINAGALSHTSIAIMDALKMLKGIMIYEVHMTDTDEREEFRKTDYVALVADKVFKGKGVESYMEALRA